MIMRKRLVRFTLIQKRFKLNCHTVPHPQKYLYPIKEIHPQRKLFLQNH